MKTDTAALIAPVSKHAALWEEAAQDSEFLFELRANRVCTDLIQALKHSGKTQTDLASALKWTKSRVSKILHGNGNLTLKTLDQLVRVLELEFDVVFREKNSQPFCQPWHAQEASQISDPSAGLRDLQNKYREKIAQYDAMLATVQDINRVAWRRNHSNQICQENIESWSIKMPCAEAA